ncbi:diguanylate cyclase [Shewanella hanedai]|uniref:diguanylate cyclase n=1 Tax=Shewanella hanedai TaxID=25 RepID=A0A553JUX4_SHEHA|nr:diguanylate cyclase [Shewanella hanedai]TRY16230.1 diguanylate cyclase [Shewanella hanedai]
MTCKMDEKSNLQDYFLKYNNTYYLSFSGDMERNFLSYYSKNYMSFRKAGWFIALFVILVVGTADWFVMPYEEAVSVSKIRYWIGIPFYIIAVIFILSSYFEKYQQEFVGISCMFVMLIQLTMLSIETELYAIFYLPCFLLLALYIGCSARMLFYRAVTVVCLNLIAVDFVIMYIHKEEAAVIISYNIYYFSAAILALSTNYFMERAVRQRFLSEMIILEQTEELNQLNEKLLRQATVDILTGLTNRRGLESALEVEWSQKDTDIMELSILLIDVDFFKKYNDGYGHLAGDDCLKLVAQGIRNTFTRAVDIVARYGGEEFIVVLPNTSQSSAEKLAKLTCENIELLALEHEYSDVSAYVTISIGVSTVLPEECITQDKAINYADTALYVAKNQGRNGYSVYDPDCEGTREFNR